MPWGLTYANRNFDHNVRGVSQTAPADRYLALYTVAPNPDGTGGTEVSAGDYARQLYTTGSAAAAGKVSNTAIVTFVASAASAWGTIVAWAAKDASTSGTTIFHGTVQPNLTVGIGSPVNIPIGQLTCEELFT